ncbi:MAG: protoporphyrinogen oxidase [Candidatus Hydrogenedentota bacterium]
MKSQKHAVVVGGGVTGLCAAYYLVKNLGRDNVTLLEAENEVGGTTRSEVAEGYACDWGPNGFLDREPATLEWISELGVSDALIRANESAKHRFIFTKGRVIEAVGPPRFFFSPMLSLKGRLRLTCEPLIPGKRDHTGETIWEFAARRIGKEAADTLVGPMVSGVFGGDARVLSLEHCFPRMAAVERDYGGLTKALIAKKWQRKAVSPMGPSGTLTSFKEGIGRLPVEAANVLGNVVRTGERVSRISRATEEFYAVETANGLLFHARAVVVAAPAYAAAEFCRELDASASETLASIEYANIAVVCTGYNEADVHGETNGFGFLVPRQEGLRILGCLWSSSIFPQQTPSGNILLRTMVGGYTDPEAVGLSDEELLGLVRRELHPIMKIGAEPEYTRIFRWPRGIPQYLIGHGETLRELEAAQERHPGLAFAGNAYRGVGLNDCVLSALQATERILAFLHE